MFGSIFVSSARKVLIMMIIVIINVLVLNVMFVIKLFVKFLNCIVVG